MLGPYAAFIVSSYAIVALVVVALIIWVIADHRRQQAQLRMLEQKGVSRRSQREAS
jgi:heme exporter protein D